MCIQIIHWPQYLLMRSYKMTRIYEIDENGIISYEENGFRYSFSQDPANSDYKAYLESLKDAAN